MSGMATFADEMMNYSLALWTSSLAASGCHFTYHVHFVALYFE